MYNISIHLCLRILIIAVTAVGQNQSGADAAPVNQSGTSMEYILGTGDVIAISVEHLNEVSGTYPISAEGEINFPTLLPPIKASGQTAKRLEALLTEHLLEYMFAPKVKVTIIERHSHKVLLLGGFQKPSVYELQHERVPLLELIFEAGGIRELNRNDELIILRNTASAVTGAENPTLASTEAASLTPKQFRQLQSIPVNLYSLLKEGDISQNIPIQNGDVIYLSSFLAESSQYVYLLDGHAAQVIPYQKDLTFLKSLLRSGIAPNTIGSEQKVRILRDSEGTQRFIEVAFNSQNYWTDAEIQLQPEDIIILPNAEFSEVYVMGNVQRPGPIEYKKDLNLLQAILAAGGANSEADTEALKIFRADEHGDRQLLVGNLSAILEGDEDAVNLPIHRGDIVIVPQHQKRYVSVSGKVNTPGLIPYNPKLNLIGAIFNAGGLSNGLLKAEVRIINESGLLHESVMLDFTENPEIQTGTRNFKLQPGDFVVVSGVASSDVIYVMGHVENPGILEYQQGMTVFRAIELRGGFAPGAAKSKVTIRRGEKENQEVIKANFDDFMKKNDRSQNIPVASGDIVFVPETFF
jgi:protein involved in polysaccharide export with SLBB domain